MINVAVVVSRKEIREGISKLLEGDGDISVIAQFASIADYLDRPPSSPSVLVIGPAVASEALESNGSSLGVGTPTVALAAFPGSSGYHKGVLEVPLELSGHQLRNSVRVAALLLPQPSTPTLT